MFALPGDATAAPVNANRDPIATPTTAPATVRPVITVTNKPAATVSYGSTVNVTFQVTASGKAWAKHAVRMGLAATGKSVEYTNATTANDGSVRVAHVATGGFTLRIVAVATDTTAEVTSPVVTVAVSGKSR
jgi:serine protease